MNNIGLLEKTFMNSYSFFMIILSFAYAIFLSFYYHLKPKIKSLDLTNFGYLIDLNLLGITLEFLCALVFIMVGADTGLAIFINKLYLIVLGFYNAILLIMSMVVSLNEEQRKKRYRRIKIFRNILLGVVLIMIIVLPINCVNDPSGVYSDGPGTSFLGLFGVFSCIMLLIYSIYGLTKNHVPVKTYFPFWAMSFGILMVFVIQSMNRHYTLVSVLETFIILIMFFTVENPDVQVIEQLKTTRKNEEEANADKSNFLSSMSHELRTPLNAIIGFTQDIQDLNTEDNYNQNDIDEDLHYILQASDSFIDIIDNIMEINQIESSEKKLKEERYVVLDKIASSIEDGYSKVQDKDIKLKLNTSKDLPKELVGDPDVLAKVIKHLLSNALKYTDEGEINIDADYNKEYDNGMLIIHVRDTGRGIPLDQRENIFKSFERGSDVRNSNIQGTGLGLAIVKNLVDLIGGEISLESEVGKGSDFMVKIPQKTE